jgi:Kef-type K+ transport system membrane component KefB
MTSLIINLLVILLTAKVLGEIVERFGQPSIIGQILAGILLGPIFLNVIQPSANLQTLAMLGVFFLMFLAGLETHPRGFVKTSKIASFVAVGGVALPIILGMLAGIYLGPIFFPSFTLVEALILGVCLSITAVAISVDILIELRKVTTVIGETIIEAGVIDDIIGLVMLAVITSVLSTTGFTFVSIGLIFLKIVLFFVIFGLLGFFIFPKLLKFSGKLKASQSLFAVTVILTIFYAIGSEFMVGSGIVGAYIAGLFTRYAVERHEEVEETLIHNFSALALGLLTPIFFVWIGILIPPTVFLNPLFLVFGVIIIIIAVFGKVIGCGLGAKLGGIEWRKSLTIGIGMNGRGAVELVIAGIALQNALISQNLFSLIVLMAFVTTIITPPLLKYSLRKSK